MELYTDGSCGQGLGYGGWAFVVFKDGRYTYGDFEGYEKTTIGWLECMAMYKAMLWCYKNPVDNMMIYSDSEYVVNAVNKWIPIWKRNEWFKKNGKPVLNQDIIIPMGELYEEIKGFVGVQWVKSHSDCMGNIMADQMANFAKENMKK